MNKCAVINNSINMAAPNFVTSGENDTNIPSIKAISGEKMKNTQSYTGLTI